MPSSADAPVPPLPGKLAAVVSRNVSRPPARSRRRAKPRPLRAMKFCVAHDPPGLMCLKSVKDDTTSGGACCIAGCITLVPEMGRVLVTGGAGFIGSHVADALVARGH